MPAAAEKSMPTLPHDHDDPAAEVAGLRARLGMTTDELAAELEVTTRTVQRWESGDREVPGMALKLMRLLLALRPAPAKPTRRGPEKKS